MQFSVKHIFQDKMSQTSNFYVLGGAWFMDNVPVLAWQDICLGEVSTGLEPIINTDMGKPCPINSMETLFRGGTDLNYF